MLKAIRALTMAAGLAAVTGCADVTAPGAAWAESTAAASTAAQSTLTFSSTKTYSGGQAASATGGTGTISFQGSVQTGNPCFDVTATHQERRTRITVTVTATSTGGFCTQVITYHDYTGAVSGLAAGTYDFQLVQVVGGSTQTVLSQQVTVS